MDGFELASQIQRLPGCANIPMVMLSSAGLKGDAQRSRDAGISGYVSKPVSREELMQVLARVLELEPQKQQALVTRHTAVEVPTGLDVLLVEDHAINQKLAVALLERWGHHVTVADNGQVALDLMVDKKFEVVLMDMMMPVMDGLEATRQIRALEAGAQHIHIIAMTANAMESDRQRCIDAGMDDYISKPIKAQELQDMLQRFLDAQVRASMPGELIVSMPTAVSVAHAPFDYAGGLASMDQEIREIISEVFVDQWPDDLGKLQSGLQSGDFKAVLHVAHALKGTLSMFGARPASELARRIESFAEQLDAPGINLLVQPLAEEVEQLLAAIQSSVVG
jgi:CheY-like chemotaxis protein/HPt (histidine-containing phosphotransfer) domain-containing protein